MGKTIGQLVSTSPATALSVLDYIELEQGGNSTGGTIGELVKFLLPPGTMQMYAGASIPAGWLLCDGAETNRTTYADLFTAIGTTWGVGNNSTTFNLPDMREASPYGAGTYSAVTGTTHGAIAAHDARTLGVFADDQMQGHFHDVNINNQTNTFGSNGVVGSTLVANTFVNAAVSVIRTDTTNGTPRIGTVTRGKTIGVNYIIKY
jgi:microcystin-dependent protein